MCILDHLSYKGMRYSICVTVGITYIAQSNELIQCSALHAIVSNSTVYKFQMMA